MEIAAKVVLTKAKWIEKKKLANISRQNQIMDGAKKKDISAMDVYITTFDEIIGDLKKIEE